MMHVRLYDSLFAPDTAPGQPVPFQTVGPQTWYRVYIHLTGHDVPFIRQVEYILPDGFTPRTMSATPSLLNRFGVIDIKTPSTGFELRARLHSRVAHIGVFEINHKIRFHEDIGEVPEFVRSGSFARSS